uniref:Expressed conserved protein n=1 Tax=Echinococcus granulosus TaxID=6210 RepID=A0A068WKA1_ECHGR|nr:expressed conserved protein [Echinococcus granulosus]
MSYLGICFLCMFGIVMVFGMPVTRTDGQEGSLEGGLADRGAIDALESRLEELFESLRQRRGNFFRFGKRSPPYHHRIDLLEKFMS